MLDLSDAGAILAWLAIAPERHKAILRVLYRLPAFARFRAAFEAAAK